MRLADVLTASRILAAPVVVWLIVTGEVAIAYYLFAAAVITDLLDGMAARRSKKKVTYGATFDGLGDFAIVYPTIITLAITDEAYFLLAAGLLSVAFLVPVIALISRRQGSLMIPHLDTEMLAAFVYPAIMVYIIDWQYADFVLLVSFAVLLYYGSKYVRYVIAN